MRVCADYGAFSLGMVLKKRFAPEIVVAIFADVRSTFTSEAVQAVCDELSVEDGSTLALRLPTALRHERDDSGLHVLILHAALMSDFGTVWPREEDIADPQLIEVLLQRRQQYTDNPSLWADLTFLLHFVTPTDDLRSQAVDAGVIESTLAVQQNYPLDHRVQVSCCLLLSRLMNSLTARKRACATNAVSVMLRGLQLHCQTQPTKEFGGIFSKYRWCPLSAWFMHALYCICVDEEDDEFEVLAAKKRFVCDALATVPALLVALRTFPAVPIAQTGGFNILTLLCEQQPASMSDFCIIPAVFAALRTHSNDMVQGSCFMLLNARREHTDVRRQAVDLGLIEIAA